MKTKTLKCEKDGTYMKRSISGKNLYYCPECGSEIKLNDAKPTPTPSGRETVSN